MNHSVNLREPSCLVCRGVHLNKNDSRASETSLVGGVEGNNRRGWHGGYSSDVVPQTTTVPFIFRNISSQSYWPIRTSCLHETPSRFSFACLMALLCALESHPSLPISYPRALRLAPPPLHVPRSNLAKRASTNLSTTQLNRP